VTGECRWRRVAWVVVVVVALSSAALAQQGAPAASGQSQVQVTVAVQAAAPQAAPYSGAEPKGGAVEAAGAGAAPGQLGLTDAQRRLMARRAALIDAQRSLAETVSPVQLSSRSLVRSFVLEDDTVRTSLDASIPAGQLVSEQMRPDGTYEVVMRLGSAAPGGLVLAAMPPTAGESSGPSSDPAAPSLRAPALAFALTGGAPVARPAAVGPFTGLIVDCRGLGISAAMSPRILDSLGKEVWGTVQIDPDIAVDRGIVGYYHTLEQARASSRAGDNPLIVRAIGRFGARSRFQPAPVVGVGDGARIVEENERTKFLETLHVCFVVD
jgi:hypothetical protein